MKPWEETVRIVPRADGQTVDVFKGDDLLLTAKFPKWPPTPEQVEQLHDELMKHVKEREHGPS